VGYADNWLEERFRENPDLADENPDLLLAAAAPEPAVQAKVTKSEKEELADEFLRLWQYFDGPPLKPEHMFHDERNWRFDFAHLGSKVAIEIEGGIWTNGRHVRGKGFIEDCVKYNAANLYGWTVFRLATGMITYGAVHEIVEYVNGLNWQE
jgi:hypothetical protein